ncbi:MAG: hypothetical protein FWD40_05970 [Treponema sp.]|nr:hypothetical protein [Treponema sp.]
MRKAVFITFLLVSVFAYAQEPQVQYSVRVLNGEWGAYVSNGAMAGSTGESRHLEAMRVRVVSNIRGSIEYEAHIENSGWIGWKEADVIAGMQSQRIEAVRMRLTGELAELYDVRYRTHMSGFGWGGWSANGNISGTTGQRRHLEAIEVVLVNKRQQVNEISYEVFIAEIGWAGYSFNGAMAGSTGQNRRLDALKMHVNTTAGGIRYDVSSNGRWLGWKANNEQIGTVGRSILEAIRVELTGDFANQFNVRYRVLTQNVGWSDWVMNGTAAGTTGQNRRIEAIEVVLVPK